MRRAGETRCSYGKATDANEVWFESLMGTGHSRPRPVWVGNIRIYVGFEAFTAETMKKVVFW
jgi:hypothetical protein